MLEGSDFAWRINEAATFERKDITWSPIAKDAFAPLQSCYRAINDGQKIFQRQEGSKKDGKLGIGRSQNVSDMIR